MNNDIATETAMNEELAKIKYDLMVKEFEHNQKMNLAGKTELQLLQEKQTFLQNILDNREDYFLTIDDVYGIEEEMVSIQKELLEIQQEQTEEAQKQIDKAKELKLEKMDESEKLLRNMAKMRASNKRELEGFNAMIDRLIFKQTAEIATPGGFNMQELTQLSGMGGDILQSTQQRDVFGLGIRELLSSLSLGGGTTINIGSFIDKWLAGKTTEQAAFEQFKMFLGQLQKEAG
jgi:hypothetical protein